MLQAMAGGARSDTLPEKNSLANAVDLRIEGKSARQTLAWAQKQPEVRYAYAIDSKYIHMDIA